MQAARLDDAFLLKAVLEQTQPGPPYSLQVPITVHVEGHDRAYQTTRVMEGKRLDLAVRLPARPLYLDIDPEFDLFRRLDRREIPPALSRAFGTQRVLIVLPGKGPDELRAGWRQLAQHWPSARTGDVEVMTDTALKALPSDRAVWLFGWENGLLPALRAALAAYDVAIAEDGVHVAGQMLRRAEHSVVLTARHPGNPDMVLAWVATAHAAALPGLGRKLPHYGQYSYLGFAGAEPTNIAKGQWPVTDSPLAVAVPQPEGTRAVPPRSALEYRHPLAELPPPFSGNGNDSASLLAARSSGGTRSRYPPRLSSLTIQMDAARAGIGRDEFLEAMTAARIGVGVHCLSIPEHPYYRQRFGWRPEQWPQAMAIGRRTVSLSLSPQLGNAEVARVVDTMRGHAAPLKQAPAHQ